MKNPLKPLVTIFAAALILSGAHAGAEVDYATDASTGLRHRLVAEEWVEALYAIDDHLTYFTAEAGRYTQEAGYTVVYSRVENGRKHSIIRHDRPEPLIYKSRALPDSGGPAGLKTPEAGEYRLARDGYSAVDLYQHATGACASDGGTPLFLIPSSNGRHKRLTRVDALSAFRYIFSTGGPEDTVWYIACEGDWRFVVEKNYRAFTGGVELATITLDRGLEGVNYAENWGRPEEPARGPLSTVVAAVAAVTGRGSRANKPTKKFLKQMAREVAFIEGNLVRSSGPSKYSGFYSDSPSEPGCAEVSINHVLYSPENNQTRIKVYDFHVCDSKVKSTGTSEETTPGRIDLLAKFFRWRP
jgi:hypothetical protein